MCGGSSAKTDRSQTLQSYGDLDSVISQLSQTGKTTTSAGATDTGAASKYFSDIVSGDPAKVMAAAAPEVNAIKGQATQQKKQIANLGGNRTGGTNAVSQDVSTNARGQIADVIAKQRTGAAGEIGKIGAGETSAGIGATSNAGTTAANLGDLSASSRKTSQQIHDAAVDQWVSVAADLLFAS
jgi:hypothetical protein